MHAFMEEQGYALDITDRRLHHEIYLSDARRTAPEKLKTVIRHPIRERLRKCMISFVIGAWSAT